MLPDLDALALPFNADRIVSDYTRMSTRKQMKGDSLRRQYAAATAWVERYGGRLEDPIRDIGISAFRGDNSKTGALAAYIERVEAGEVPRGSVLFVENCDRLSRDTPFRAYDLVRNLLRLGIYVVVSDLKWVLSEETFETHPDRLQALFNVMQRSHNESVTKAVRSLEAGDERRRRAINGTPYSRTGPAWLIWTEERWEKHPERSRVVERIFNMALDGNGSYRIAITLNQEGVPTFGGSAAWQSSYVSKILRNPAVVGTWQPKRIKDGKSKPSDKKLDPVENYFPQVIDKATFLKVQREILPKNSAGSKGKYFTNVFTGRCRCSLCGSMMMLVSSQKKGKKKFGYLVCSKKSRFKECDAPRNFRSDLIEDGVLRHLDIDLGRLVRDDAKSAQVHHLVKTTGDVEYTLQQAQIALNNYTDALGMATPASMPTLMGLINQRTAEISALSAEVDKLKEDLGKLKGAPPDLAANLQRLRDKLDVATGEAKYRLRARLAHVLAHAISEMVADPIENEVRVRTGGTTYVISGAGDLIGVLMPRYDVPDTVLREWSDTTEVGIYLLGETVRIDTVEGAVMYKLTYAPAL